MERSTRHEKASSSDVSIPVEYDGHLMTPVDDKTAASLLGEGIHTGLRKGTDAEDSHELWKAISDSDTTAWSDAIDYCLWGLKEMGYQIYKVES